MSGLPPWRAMAERPVSTEDEFVAFLERVGVCLWTPFGRAALPNLADVMDLAKPGDIWGTWFWKDDLHVARRLYYGKLLAGRPTFVSMRLLPALIAARGDVDPHTYHEQGRLSAEAVRVYEALVRCSDLPTADLRRQSGLAAKGERTAFERSVTALGALFQICKTGITGRTRGTYSYRWGLVENWLPEALEDAAQMRPHEAAGRVFAQLDSVGAALTRSDMRRMFGWDEDTLDAVGL